MPRAAALVLVCLCVGWACRASEPVAPASHPRQAPTRAPESEPSGSDFETSDPCAPATQAATRHAEGLVARIESDESARHELSRMGRSAWEPVRAAASRSETARVLLAKLVDTCATQTMARQAEKDTHGYALDWELEATFEQLPYVRVYKARPRYPRALVLDLLRGVELTGIDVGKMNELLSAMGLAVSSAAEAETLVAAYIRLHYQPYEARALEVFATAEASGFAVKAVFQRTTPWSPPPEPGRPMSAIVGSKTSRHELRARVTRDARLTAVAEIARDLSTHP